VGVFPEGTRGAGDFAELNDGLAYLAVRSGAAVVPVVVEGTAAALPKGARLPRLRAPVRITFGAPTRLVVAGPPYARRTVAAAGEELAGVLRAHLAAVTTRTAVAAAPPAEPRRPEEHPPQEQEPA
jgi:1-acyl-sn-glycerol-3-phosphate acyltransferase